jgi:two-component system, OmpR family, phosphate regulon sensor histidine kinase PhoR
MEWLLFAFGIILALLWLGYRRGRVGRVLRSLEEAIRQRRPYLASAPGAPVVDNALPPLADAINGLLHELSESKREETDTIEQIEATLTAIHEAIIIVNQDRHIIFANAFAGERFSSGRPLVGLRLEEIFHGSELFRFIVDAGDVAVPRSREVLTRLGEREAWFEVSISRMRKAGWVEGNALLLILHDITRLKQLERLRKDFVANVSHELKTPLTIIKGYAETLRDDNHTMDPGERLRFVEKIVNNTERLNRLVEDLLTLSRLESKAELLNTESFDLVSFLEDVVEPFRARLAAEPAKQISVIVGVDLQDYRLRGDRFRLQQVIENLLENAFKHAPNFKLIKVEARRHQRDNLLELGVCDDGPGIPARDVAHVFERFYRVDKGRSRERGGTGLGLSIVKHIIQLHGGTVRLESKEGAGCCFWISLPQ